MPLLPPYVPRVLAYDASITASPESDSDNGVLNDFEGSDDDGTQTDISVSESEDEYLLDPNLSSREDSEIDESNMACLGVHHPWIYNCPT